MADRYISVLPSVEEIEEEDLFVLEKNSDGTSRKLRGEQLTEFVNRNIMTITVETLAEDEPAQVIDYDPDTGELTLGIPRGASIADIQKTSTTGLYDTYTITFEAPYGGTPRPPITFIVKNGDYITGVTEVSAPHTHGQLDTYQINFAERDPVQFQVYNGENGAGSFSVQGETLIVTTV